MKVIFLDIDGVLQPHSWQHRFEHMAEVSDLALKLNKELHNGFDYYDFAGGDKEKNNKSYINKYDIAAVYWDWQPDAVASLHKVLDETGAKLVMSTDWRGRGNDVMKGLIDIQGFGKYFYGSTYFALDYGAYSENVTFEQYYENRDAWRKIYDDLYEKLKIVYPSANEPFSGKYLHDRAVEIMEYLDRHEEITSYAAIDDMYLEWGLGKHFVFSNKGYIQQKQADELLAALSIEDGPYHLPDSVKTPELEEWRKKWVDGSKYYY